MGRVAAWPPGSPELQEFNRRVRSRVIEMRRNLSKFVNSPPAFGFRGVGAEWLTHLSTLNKERGFRKSVTMKPVLEIVERTLADDTNMWAQYLPKWQNQMDPVTLAFMQRGEKFSLADFRNAQFARGVLFRRIQVLFDRYDFLVTPTASRTALDVTHDAANDEVVVDGVKCGITRQGWTSYQYPYNLTGHPALAVPSGFGTDHLPTSVQIVGKWAHETDVLRLGALLEAARPWAQHRPKMR